MELEKQKIEIEKQKLEFDRLVGSQLLTLVPMVGGLLQRLSFSQTQELLASSSNGGEPKNSRKRHSTNDLDILKDSKILRTVLEQGIKKYMMADEAEDAKNSDNEDSGIHNDENSSGSEK